jgi:SAM-dependent methyltransferase
MRELAGFCPICFQNVLFQSLGDWHRDQLICPGCQSVPRERALASVLERERPNYRDLIIHESSPVNRGISAKLKTQCKSYFESQYFDDSEEKYFNSVLNINLEDQRFPDESFDLFISLDVMEHVFNPDLAFQEILRTLKPSGIGILTFPIIKSQTQAVEKRAILSNGIAEYLKTPEYHGNPINSEGSLVTVDYGYDIHLEISNWTNANVEIIRFCRSDIGIIGEFTEVVILRK